MKKPRIKEKIRDLDKLRKADSDPYKHSESE